MSFHVKIKFHDEGTNIAPAHIIERMEMEKCMERDMF